MPLKSIWLTEAIPLNLFPFLFFFNREFAKEKSRQTKSGKFQKIREKHLVDEALKGYLDWIQQAGLSEFFRRL